MPREAKAFTLQEVALLIDGSVELHEETSHKLSATLRDLPQFAAQVEQLEELARQAGIEPGASGRFDTALAAHRDFDRLLAADNWQHPAEILDPDGETGISYRELLSIATFRAAAPDAPPEVAGIKERLEQLQAARRAESQRVESFVDFLCEQEPAKALELLRLAEMGHRMRRQAMVDPSSLRQGRNAS